MCSSDLGIANPVLTGDWETGLTPTSAQTYRNVYGQFGFRVFPPGGYGLDGLLLPGSSYDYLGNTPSAGGTNLNNPVINFYSDRLETVGIWDGENTYPYRNRWPADTALYPDTGTLGLCANLFVSESKQYYVGIAGDNYLQVKVTNQSRVTIIGTSRVDGATIDTQRFKYWSIYPITLQAGYNIIE